MTRCWWPLLPRLGALLVAWLWLDWDLLPGLPRLRWRLPEWRLPCPPPAASCTSGSMRTRWWCRARAASVLCSRSLKNRRAKLLWCTRGGGSGGGL